MGIWLEYEMVSIHLPVSGLVNVKAENLRKLRGAIFLTPNSSGSDKNILDHRFLDCSSPARAC